MIEKTFQFENEDDVELVERLISKTAPKTVSNILSNPEEWFSKAESLYSVACELEKSYKKKANENNRKEIWRIDFDYAWSVFMVYAFCIENLLKGLIVKKHIDEYGPNCSLAELKKKVFTHRLIELLIEFDSSLLGPIRPEFFDKLQDCATWRGRYPSPKSDKELEARREYSHLGESYVDFMSGCGTEDFNDFHSTFKWLSSYK